MALVAYGSSGESDVSDNEDEIGPKPILISKIEQEPKKSSRIEPEPTKSSVLDGEISDEEETEWIGQSNPEELDIPGLSSSQSIFSVLPQASASHASQKSEEDKSQDYVDANEDLSTIPEPKAYEKNIPKIPTIKNRKGPVRIFAPSVVDLGDDSDDDRPTKKPVIPILPGPRKSTLLSLIPAPKNTKGIMATSSESTVSSTSTSTLSKPNAFVPRFVARPPPAKIPVKSLSNKNSSKPVSTNDEDSSDEENGSFAFFTLEKEEIIPTPEEESQFKSKLSAVKSTPQDFHMDYQPPIENAYGPAIAPYPPPAPSSSQGVNPDDLLADEEAMQRLVGKTGSKRKNLDSIDFIEVNNDDLKPDPREWMVKALSEDHERGEPGPKNLIKGEKKRKHQITYLAAMAKEREHVLKQQWSQNAQTRRATQSKYGF